MNLDDLKQLLELARAHDLEELEIERNGEKIRIRKAGHHPVFVPSAVSTPMPMTAAPAAAPMASVASPTSADPPASADPVDLAVIKSPIVGTFYRSSEPGAPSFVDVGDTVKKGQVLCIIEAMKLMNEIESDCDGVIAAAYVENGKAVQFGDRLFAVKVE